MLAAIDGRATLADVAEKVGKAYDAAFQSLISQLDKNGFIREVSPGAGATPRPGATAAPKPAAKPAARAMVDEPSGGDLDFSALGKGKPPMRPAAPPTPSPSAMEQTSALAKAREEAEAKAQAEKDRLKREAELKARIEMEAKARAEAEAKVKADAEAKVNAAREAAVRAAAEAKAKAEAEAKAKIEAERKAREEAERARKEAEDKAKREAEELRERLEAERKAREEAERKAKEETERARRELEDEKKRLAAERERERAEIERRRAEEQALVDAAAAAIRSSAAVPPPPPAATPESFADSLLADLANFTNREEEERKAQEEEDRKTKAAAAAKRAREALERQAKEKEEAEQRQRAEEEERRLADEARRVREEEEQRAQEDERRRREAEAIRRKAEAATAAAMAKEGKVAPEAEDEIPITDDDVDADEVKREQGALAKAKRKGKGKEPRAEKPRPAPAAPRLPRRPVKWGKPVAVTLIALLAIALGVVHVMPINTADYERLASEALGRPVKIGSANLWLFSGLPEVRFKDVRAGEARLALIKASGSPFAIFGDSKEFSTIEVNGLKLPQEAIGDALFATVRANNFSVSRIVVKNLELPGPATLPKGLSAEVRLNARGAMASADVYGPDGLHAKLTPRERTIEFDVLAGGFPLPIGPQITLSNFAMKGTATPRGMTISEWGGALFSGGISGRANVRWGGGWQVEGVLTVRNINAAVFAPALLSAGSGEGTAKFSMSGPDAASLANGSRLDGNFTVNKGTLGSFDLARAIQSGGKQANGSTQFAEMNGQAIYDRGMVALRNVTIGAGALNAGASADISQSGALSGRIVADMKTASRMLSATLLLGGTVKEPQVRN
ncbi:MAG: hypothetical protein E6H77_11645 [Betaproteobacteria bacterium]|nr:MAG: hypothetical protein E6H77_11645 [Betaproteobacteria bacterium]